MSFLCAIPKASAITAALAFLFISAPSGAQDFAAENTYDAFLEPYQAVDISSPFRDRISIIHVKDGDSVAKDQVLAELSTSVLTARKKQAEKAAAFQGAVRSAKALVTMRKNRIKLLKELDTKGNVRPQEMINARTDLSIAEAQFLESKEQKELSQLDLVVIETQLEEKKLRSPIDGVVVKVHKQEAELVGGVDERPLMTVVQLDPLAAIFHLPLGYTKTMAENMTITVEIGENPVQGMIEYISPIIDPQSGTVQIKVIIPNAAGELTSGSRCTLLVGLE